MLASVVGRHLAEAPLRAAHGDLPHEDVGHLGHRRVEIALLDDVPVDDVQPFVDVFGAPVLVVEVVGVLPHVDAEQRLEVVGDRAVLVGRRHDQNAIAV